jgi:hypothetical protein
MRVQASAFRRADQAQANAPKRTFGRHGVGGVDFCVEVRSFCGAAELHARVGGPDSIFALARAIQLQAGLTGQVLLRQTHAESGFQPTVGRYARKFH